MPRVQKGVSSIFGPVGFGDAGNAESRYCSAWAEHYAVQDQNPVLHTLQVVSPSIILSQFFPVSTKHHCHQHRRSLDTNLRRCSICRNIPQAVCCKNANATSLRSVQLVRICYHSKATHSRFELIYRGILRERVPWLSFLIARSHYRRSLRPGDCNAH